MTRDLLPRAKLRDVLFGRAPLVGARCDDQAERGFVSPVEARVAMGIPYGDLREDERRYLDERTPKSDAGVVMRSLLAQMLAPGTGGSPLVRPHIVSARVDNITIEDAIEKILEKGPKTHARMIHFVHAHALNLAAFDRAFQRRLEMADLVLPDGIGIRVAAGLLGITLHHNINGTDLLPPLCRRAAEVGMPLALVGAGDGVADETARRLIESTPGLQIPFVHHGYIERMDPDHVIGEISKIGPAVVLVGMGSPRQEHWAWEYLREIPGVTVVTVGGLFDFYSGRIPRASVVWRELGLEWLWRIQQEPSRLAKRYLVGNPLFLTLALKQKLLDPDQEL